MMCININTVPGTESPHVLHVSCVTGLDAMKDSSSTECSQTLQRTPA